MAIADRINEMYTHVGDVYDTITNVDLPTNKNIQNIPSTMRSSYLEIMNNGIDKIWNNWEKVTGSGTDISLSPTLEAPMRNVLNGNTYQFTTTGKNLLDTTNISTISTQTGITITPTYEEGLLKNLVVSGTPTTTSWNTIKSISLKAGSYILTGLNISDTTKTGLRVGVYIDSARQYFVSANSTSYSFTLSEETGMNFVVWVQNVNSYPTGTNIITPMIRLSSVTDDTYEPYTGGQASPNPQYPQDIHVVSGDNEINVCGKNLFNKDTDIVENYTFGGTGNLINDNNFFYQSYYIPVDANTTYSFLGQKTIGSDSLRVCEYKSDKTFIKRNYELYTITTTAETKYIRVSNYKTKLNTTQLEKGSSATSYEPYQGNTYNIDLPVENLLDLTSLVQRTSSTGASNIQKNSFEQIGTGTWGNTYFYFKNDEKNTNYTISLKALSSLARRTGVSVYGGANTEASTEFTNIGTQWLDINANIQGSTSYSFNSGNYEYLMFRFWNNGTATALSSNVTLYMNDIQLEKGSKANSYTPFGTTPIELCDFNTYKDNFLRTSGKNLFDKDNANIVNAFINPTGYVLQANDNMRTLYIPCKPNTTYTVSKIQSARFVLGTSNTIEIGSSMTNGRNNFTATQLTITSGANDTYLLVFFYNGNADTLTPQQILDTIQIEEGTTATDYEPYGSGEWYTHKELGKAIIDENIVGGALTDSNQRIMFSSSSNPFLSNVYISTPSSASNLTPSLSNYFSSSAQSEITPTNNKVGFSKWGDTTFVYFSAIYNSVADFKTWLSTHNVVVYYVLATPNYNKITYEPLLEQLEAFYNAKSKNSQTNITQENNDLPFIIDSTMLKEV